MRGILFDVEGTITSLTFVKDELFPYARHGIRDFIRANGGRQDIQACLDRLGRELGTSDVEAIATTLVRWIDEDQKHPDLKDLQGFIWAEGYRSGVFRGHLYPDVVPCWEQARRAGVVLAIYSSGSIQAQRLLLQHSVYGDVSNFITAHFDTGVGAKANPDSYVRIASSLALPGGEILFCSDALPELDAAREAGFMTCRLLRPGVPRERHDHPEVADCTGLLAMTTARS